MSISPPILERLLKAEANQDNYTPGLATPLWELNLIKIVAPAALGKSYIMEATAKLHPDYGQISKFTTRPQQARDVPGNYRYIEYDDEHVGQLLNEIEQGKIVQYAIFPTTKHIYGTELSDYKFKNNMLDTLSGSVNQLQQLPFKKNLTVALVSNAHEFIDRFTTRYPKEGEDERTKRIEEGKICLYWVLEQDPSSLIWIENVANNPEQTVTRLVEAIEQDDIDPKVELRSLAEDMLAALKELK